MPDNDGYWFTAKYDSICDECENPIVHGDRAGKVRRTQAILCPDCAPEFLGSDPTGGQENEGTST